MPRLRGKVFFLFFWWLGWCYYHFAIGLHILHSFTLELGYAITAFLWSEKARETRNVLPWSRFQAEQKINERLESAEENSVYTRGKGNFSHTQLLFSVFLWWISKSLSESVSTITWLMHGETREQTGNFTRSRLPSIPARNSTSILLLQCCIHWIVWTTNADSAEIHAKALLNYHQYWYANHERNWVSPTQNMPWEWSVPSNCDILTRTCCETGKGSRQFWWPAQPSLLRRWAEGFASPTTLSTQVVLESFCSPSGELLEHPAVSFSGVWHPARGIFFGNPLFTFTLSTYFTIVTVINACIILFWQQFSRR